MADEKKPTDGKRRTISAVFWSALEAVAAQGAQFLVGLVLARLLTPRDFGLVALAGVFIAVSQVLVEGGLSQALIRKQHCSNEDYSTVFHFNIGISVLAALSLALLSQQISRLLGQPDLKPLLPAIACGIVLNAASTVQRTILTKAVDFRTQTWISLASTLLSGTVAVVIAVNDGGVWSLVSFALTRYGANTALLWCFSNWRPRLVFSISSFRELAGFGSKLMASGLLNTVFDNIYYVVIGKYWSPAELGQYTRADQFRTLPAQGLTTIVGRVAYPILCSLQHDTVALKSAYRRIIRTTMLLSCLSMSLLAASSETLVLVLLGDQWLTAAEYLKLLAILGALYPLHSLNLTMLQVHGRSDLFLYLELAKKTLVLPTIAIGIVAGTHTMICAMIANSVVAYLINSYWSAQLVGYPRRQQIVDIAPSFLLALSVAIPVWTLGTHLGASAHITLLLQSCLAVTLTLSLAELSHHPDYLYLKNAILGHHRKPATNSP